MLNTFKSMIRPGFIDQENTNIETNEEAKTTTMESKKQQSNTTSTPTFEQFSTVNYGMLNSDIFTNDSENVKVAEPRDFDDAEVIAEAIKAGKTVIMFLDNLEKGLQQRIIDYIGGYCRAYNILPEQMRSGWVIDPKHKRTQNYR